MDLPRLLVFLGLQPPLPSCRGRLSPRRRFRVMDTDPEIWTSLMWCNFLRPVESRVYEEAKDKTKAPG